MTRALTEYIAVQVKEVGEYSSGYTILTAEETGVSERSLVSPGVTNIFGRNADDQFVQLATVKEPQTDGDTFSIEFYGHSDLIETLVDFKQRSVKFFTQILYFNNPPVDVASLAKKVEHYLVQDTGVTIGAGRNRDGSGGLQENSIALTSANTVISKLGTSISALTNTLTEDGMSIAMLKRQLSRDTGYRGPDTVIYAGLDDDAVNPGVIAVSVDKGSSWAELATDPDPFSEVSGIDNLVLFDAISDTQFRIIAGRTTDASNKAMFAYGDVTYGDEATAPTWTVVTIAATSNADAVEAFLWPQGSRLYIAAAGDIYLSTDLGVSDPGTAIFTGSNAIAQMFYDFERNVWAVGASNAILFEDANSRGTFSAKTGPSGGGAFTAFARATDGTIYAGNGTSIYRNTNKAQTASGWTSLKDFAANHAVTAIQCVKGSSEILRAVVTDGTANDGDIWQSTDGGETWTEKTNVTNNGYDAAVWSDQNPDLMFVTGPIDTNPIIHKLS